MNDIYFKRYLETINEKGEIISNEYTVQISNPYGYGSCIILDIYNSYNSLVEYEFKKCEDEIRYLLENKYKDILFETNKDAILYFVQEVIETIKELIIKNNIEIINYCTLYDVNNYWENIYDSYIHYEACKILSDNIKGFVSKRYDIEFEPRKFNCDLLNDYF